MSDKEYEVEAGKWFCRYVSEHFYELGDGDIYLPLWQLLGLACEIRYGSDPATIPDKFEKIPKFAAMYIEKRGFPKDLVEEIARIALAYATGVELPANDMIQVHPDLARLSNIVGK